MCSLEVLASGSWVCRGEVLASGSWVCRGEVFASGSWVCRGELLASPGALPAVERAVLTGGFSLCDHAVGGLGAGAGAAASARGGGEEYYYRLSKPLNPVTFPEYQSLLIVIMVVYFEYKL